MPSTLISLSIDLRNGSEPLCTPVSNIITFTPASVCITVLHVDNNMTGIIIIIEDVVRGNLRLQKLNQLQHEGHCRLVL